MKLDMRSMSAGHVGTTTAGNIKRFIKANVDLDDLASKKSCLFERARAHGNEHFLERMQ